MCTNYFIKILQTVDVINSYWFLFEPIINIIFSIANNKPPHQQKCVFLTFSKLLSTILKLTWHASLWKKYLILNDTILVVSKSNN